MCENKALEYLAEGNELADTGDFAAAVHKFKMASRAGAIEAKVNRANILSMDGMPEKDKRTALRLYKEAVSQGIAEAACNLSITYMHAGNRRMASYWCNRAIAMGADDVEDLLESIERGLPRG